MSANHFPASSVKCGFQKTNPPGDRRPHHTEEVVTNASQQPWLVHQNGDAMKTMAIRLEDELHAQLSVVAGLEGQTVTDVIRAAVLAYIEERKGTLSNKAEEALADIERDATARREAIAALFGSTSPPATTEATEQPGAQSPASRSSRGRRGGATS